MAELVHPRVPGAESLPAPIVHSQPPAAPGQAGYFPVVVSAPRTVPWFLDIGGVAQRHTLLMVVGFLACAAFGYLFGTVFKTNYWTIEGRLRFMVQRPELNKPQYDSMSLSSYADLFANEALLKPIAVEFAERLPRDNPIRYLQKEVKVDTPRMADQIELKYDAVDKDYGMQLVTRMMDRHIEFTDEMRRNAKLTLASTMLKQKIADATATIDRLNETCKEYRARVRATVPIEKLETAELDSYYSQRRRSLKDDIERQKKEIKKSQITLDDKKTKYEVAKSDLTLRAAVQRDVDTAKMDYESSVKQIELDKDELRRMEELYRNVPIEYADSEIVKQDTVRTVAAQDVKVLDAKIAAAKERGVSVSDIDSQDDEWRRLRPQLLGTDNSEFSVIKPATAPAYANVSNRKTLTGIGFAAPFALFFLVLAGYDRLNAAKPRPVLRTPEPEPVWPDGTDIAPPPGDESALLKARMSQWLQGKSAKRTPN